MMNVCL